MVTKFYCKYKTRGFDVNHTCTQFKNMLIIIQTYIAKFAQVPHMDNYSSFSLHDTANLRINESMAVHTTTKSNLALSLNTGPKTS